MNNVVVWLQQELRTRDHPALALGAELAAARGGKVLPLYIFDTSPKVRAMGRASQWWVHHALVSLQQNLPGLVLRQGAAEEILPALVQEVGASDVVWPLAADPAGRARDAQLAAALQAQGVTVHAVAPNLLCPPGTVRNGSGADFKVFTPFWKACLGHLHQHPPKVRGVVDFGVLTGAASERLEDWELLPTKPNWAAGWENVWQPGEAGAWARLEGFVAEGPGANVFYEKDGALYTPETGYILNGITRQTVLEICKDFGISVTEKQVTHEALRHADAAFFCGTGVEVIGWESIDDQVLPMPFINSICGVIRKAYLALVREDKATYESCRQDLMNLKQ